MTQISSKPENPATKWWFLGFASVALFGNYYVGDAIAPVADMLSRELGFTDFQIGSLNAIYSLPNIFLVLIGGLLIDRYGAGRVGFWCATICVFGAGLSASIGEYLPIALGRFFFGLGAETFIVAITVMIALRFGGHVVAFAMALNLSFGRIGSYVVDLSPVWAGGVYDAGWQGPFMLAAMFAALAMLAMGACWWFEANRPAQNGLAFKDTSQHTGVFRWRDIANFDRSYWYVAALCVLFYSVVFPFRSTFAIKYFQHAHGETLEAASIINSYVFLAAIILSPIVGWLADKIGRRGFMMMIGSLLLPLSFAGLIYEGGAWITTGLLGISFSAVPAILWPSVTKLVKPRLMGTAFGLLTMIQAVGLVAANLIAGWLNDQNSASAENPGGYAAMLIFFAAVASMAFIFAWLLWQREKGPHGHGLEDPR